MKTQSFFAVVAAVVLPGMAFAGGLGEPVPEVVVAAAAPVAVAQDWSGLYGGITAGKTANGRATFIYSGIPNDFYDLSGRGAGLFVGYNMQRNAMVYGVEVAAQAVDYAIGEGDEPHFTSMIDLKVRGGVAVGRALPYAFIGYSTGAWENLELTSPNATGVNYGVGVDFALSEAWFAGAEYIQRTMSTDFNENDNGVDIEFGTVQLRLGYRF